MLTKDDQDKVQAFLAKSSLAGAEALLQKRLVAVNESLGKTAGELQNLQNQVTSKQGEVAHLNGQLTGLVELALAVLDSSAQAQSAPPTQPVSLKSVE